MSGKGKHLGDTRGGNSRLLARVLDEPSQPIAVLDARGVISFANAALCAMAGVEATQLVGKRCSWQVAADQPLATILTLLAPPAGARDGRIVSRQLSSPPVFGSPITGQLFLPLLGDDGGLHLTLVYLGEWDRIRRQLPAHDGEHPLSRRDEELALVAVRSRWRTLDGLTPLIGTSPAMRLAMSRAQLATKSLGNVVISGARHVGKAEVARGILAARLKGLGLRTVDARHMPIDCSATDQTLIPGLLEVFTSRLRADAPPASQHLLLENLDQLDAAAVEPLIGWLAQHQQLCAVSATLSEEQAAVSARGGPWQQLMADLAHIEIHMPPFLSRREDLSALAVHLLASYCDQAGRGPMRFSSDAMDLLQAYPWPSNLRQLRGVVEEAAQATVQTSTIGPSQLPTPLRTFPGSVRTSESAKVEPIEMDQVLLDVERTMISRALKLSPRNRAQAARLLGISRPRLLRRIEQLGLVESVASAEEESE